MSSNGNSSASLKLPVYLDNHATTPLDPRVLEAMLPFFTSVWQRRQQQPFLWLGGRCCRRVSQAADRLLPSALSPQEIVFTSGATESDNLAVLGVAEAPQTRGNHIITAVSEHKAILDSCKYLEKHGCRITWLPVKSDGRIDLDQLQDALTGETILVTIMAANNETGVLQPIEEIGRLCRERGVLFHSDAVQALGQRPAQRAQRQS